MGVDEAQPVMVVRGPRPMAYFDGGPHVVTKKVYYEFWTLESECKPIPGRYLAGNNPAARFRDLKRQRHEHPLYEKAWQCAHTAKSFDMHAKKR